MPSPYDRDTIQRRQEKNTQFLEKRKQKHKEKLIVPKMDWADQQKLVEYESVLRPVDFSDGDWQKYKVCTVHDQHGRDYTMSMVEII